MSEACCTGHAGQEPRDRLACPKNGQVGRPVQRVTPGALLRPEARARFDARAQYWFCPARDCDVVYYAADATFCVQDVIVPVWQKQPAPTTPVCYCFGWTPAKINAFPEPRKVLDDITAKVRSGACSCELTNPQGACCLGNVAAVVTSSGSLT